MEPPSDLNLESHKSTEESVLPLLILSGSIISSLSLLTEQISAVSPSCNFNQILYSETKLGTMCCAIRGYCYTTGSCMAGFQV